MKTEKKLVILTLIVAITLFSIVIYINKPLANIAVIDTSKQPTLGESTASVHVVAFESLKCLHCKHYMETIYPDLKKQYIDSGKITYTPILITGSLDSATEAAYCIDKQDHDEFFKFIDITYKNLDENKIWTINQVLSMATQLPKININSLHQCLDEGEFAHHVDDNTKELLIKIAGSMPAVKGVPALFVNGRYVEDLTQENLFQLIDAQLKNVTTKENK